MIPQYAQRQTGGEIAIWLLITVGALLIPIIVIAICCIRRHLLKSPTIKRMEIRSPHMPSMTIKQVATLRSYDGPYKESGHDNRIVTSANSTPQTLSRTSSIKKQHVHWPDGSTKPKGDDLRSIKDRQFTPRKQPYPGGEIFNTSILTESPSSHRRTAVIPAPSSALSHLIQTAIIPAGSSVTNAGANQRLMPSKQLTPSHLPNYTNIV
ncbi:unnamed protein product [Adineta steineri]|uniref:Uncharacterized protein n=1 Tax=Adineta steineri TaxID=433720 RepID=A0A815MZB2_9BILA|nr:unnamed protein product [Adineta steineri]CAF3731690.1 unnamed protein product [Adineta steineri]